MDLSCCLLCCLLGSDVVSLAPRPSPRVLHHAPSSPSLVQCAQERGTCTQSMGAGAPCTSPIPCGLRRWKVQDRDDTASSMRPFAPWRKCPSQSYMPLTMAMEPASPLCSAYRPVGS
ncbi:hypothetical protein GGR57DRAFT_469838 [Xylariaceae sp. FL1272]|nr:hypothetical protein GGR57DRAFT_469838 [Xylariaceae sp. FL1272]